MAEIVPAILVRDPSQYRSKLEAVSSFARRIQVDITDGNFAQNTTIPAASVWWPKGWQLDLHMMVASPLQHLPVVLKLQPSLVIFHAETGEDLLPIFNQLKANNIKSGVALLKTTYPGKIASFIQAADHVLIFAGDRLGAQGSDADLLQTEKVPIIRSINSQAEIGWDGGINLQNIRAIAHADVDILNVGGAISDSPSPAEAYHALVAESEKKGVLI